MRKPTEADLDRLDDFLLSLGEDAMPLGTLDGFLAGIVVCPDLILPGEWLPAIWGEDGPAFADLREANEILAIIMARYNEIAHGLGRRETFEPILPPDTDGAPLWEIWAEGLAVALALRPDSWEAYCTGDKEVTKSFACLAALAGMAAEGKSLPKEDDEKVRRGAHALIADCLAELHAARLAMHAASAGAQPKPGVGRNDPCPCGSGKKFKKCCLGRSSQSTMF